MTAWWKQGLKINMPEIGQKDHILKYKALFVLPLKTWGWTTGKHLPLQQLGTTAASETSPSPRAEGIPARAPSLPRGRGAPHPRQPTSHLPLQAAGSNALQPPQRPRRARPEPAPVPCARGQPGGLPGCASQSRRSPSPHRERLAPPAARGPAPAAARSGSPPARSPVRPPAAPRSLRPARPASRRLPRRTPIPPRPALAPPIGSAGCQATYNRGPHWPGEDRSSDLPPRPRANGSRLAAAATAPVTPRVHPAAAPCPQLSPGAGGGSQPL
ncbi:vegetative cell wall protein gp1-like [Mesocricetus auratus]|uniref:Vegetative cell wall protein gp1-like n=1 Tax=Mesocricetus auratus TaxID=10036 RepID=A0ABM2Y1S2_MESAU|nr:vegetative cell wall protein gp1-like [Mesocricetus auratus]